jgi:hypothetical protein
MKCNRELLDETGRTVKITQDRRGAMNAFKWISPAVVVAGLIALSWTASPNAHATASFSRQTGLACSTCHTTFPELTPFGRDFKLNGYTLSSAKEVTEKGEKKQSGLSILENLPLSINLRGSFTQTGNRQPGTRNSNIELPQQVNLWFAGKLAEHIGSYTQMTYNVQANHFGFDNSDFFRYSRQTNLADKNLTWGIDANNNPTFEDLWQSTPGYGFPWAAPDAVVSPVAATLIDGTLGGDVVGLGAYGMWNDHLYGDVTLYRTQHIGGPQPATGLDSTGTVPFAHNIKGAAPYWRFAWQASKGDNYIEVGTYGIHANSFPGAISGPTDTFTDTAADLTYERKLWKGDLLTVHSTFIYEKQDLDATFLAEGASQAKHILRTYRLDAGYHFGNRYSVTAGPFFTNGTADATLYPATAVTGSANHKPNNTGYIAQFAYWPVQNIEMGVQYKGYTTFNGAGSNYDDAGRAASANNYTYGFVWISF